MKPSEEKSLRVNRDTKVIHSRHASNECNVGAEAEENWEFINDIQAAELVKKKHKLCSRCF